MLSFDLMKVQTKQPVVAEPGASCFNGAVTNNARSVQYNAGTPQGRESSGGVDGLLLSTAAEGNSEDDSHASFNNAAPQEHAPICLGSLFVLYMLQTIEPAILLLEFIVFA